MRDVARVLRGESPVAARPVGTRGGGARANKAVSVEALGQLGVFDTDALERLTEFHRPPTRDPRGVEIATTVPIFQLAPFSELS